MLNLRIDCLYEKYKKEKNKNKEKVFRKSPQYSYLYALNVKKERLKDENVFLLDMYHAYLYSLNVINLQHLLLYPFFLLLNFHLQFENQELPPANHLSLIDF
jgi:hypothetical protein